MHIGIYGGTFNPPHLGHLAAIQAAMETLELDRLLMVPAALPPHKALPEETPSAAARLDMTWLAADSLLDARVEVAALELERSGASYTADTLQALRNVYPEDTLWLLVGGDMLLSLAEWQRPEEIMTYAHICAFARTPEEQDGRLQAQAATLRQTYGAQVQVIELPHMLPVSSTQVREQLVRRCGGESLPPGVYGYILRKHLYGTNYDLRDLPDAELRACSYSMIRAKRIAHVRGAEEEAVRLARRWGADEKKAARAAILHDCTKYDTVEEHLQICETYGITLDEVEKNAEKLLHAKTGAWLARDVYGACDDIFQAIFYHTTGQAEMSLLEKILYIADYIEPNRDFHEVGQMRTLAYEDLDRAVMFGCELSIQEMAERGRTVHPNTVQALAWLRGLKGIKT